MSFCFPSTYPPVFSEIKPYRLRLYIEGMIPFTKGLAAWNKLKTNRSNGNYSLIIYEEKHYPVFAILVNKNAFIEKANKHIDVIQKTYGTSTTSVSFLRDLEEKKIKPQDLFQHHLLLGIMLGYGKHSAELFQRRWILEYGEFKPPLLEKQTVPSQGFFSIEEEVHYLTERIQARSKILDWYTNTFEPFLRVTPVVFAFDPADLEAQELIKKYKNLHAELTVIFDREDWLEVILQKLLAK